MIKKSKRFCVILILFSISMFCNAQLLDLLIIKADTLKIFSIPLKQYPDSSQIIIRKLLQIDAPQNTFNWLEFVATWKIENDNLYLLSIKTNTKNKPVLNNADFREIFHDKYANGRVLADWFSGSLYSPIGKRVFVADDGYKTSYEKERELIFQNGKLLGEKILDNSKSRQLRYDTITHFKDGNYFNSLINWVIIPKISGADIRVNVNFSANEDGIIDEVRVMRPRGDVFDSEAIRVVKTLPANVQIYHGKLRRQIWTMPVTFKESSRKR